MKHLLDFLFESFIAESFDKVFDNTEEYVDYFKNKYTRRIKWSPADEEFVRFMMDDVWDNDPKTVPFRIDDGADIVKLLKSYRDNDKVVRWLEEHNDLQGRPITIWNDTFKVGNITFKWGSGSVGKSAATSKSIPTDMQEQITCDVFNRYFGTLKGDLSIDNIDRDGWNDKFNEYFNNKNYKEWVITWVEQYKVIYNVVKGWNNVVAVRYGDKNDEVAKKLLSVHQQISKICRSPKDTFDPSDILIYDKSKVSTIINSLDTIIAGDMTDMDSIIKAGVSAIMGLFNDNAYIGVSLKKGKSFRPVFMNFEPAKGFENASLQPKIALDPVYDFFGDDNQLVDEFMQMTEPASKEYYKEIVKQGGRKRNKSCRLVADCDDERNIIINIRTNQSSYHSHLVIEPQLNKAKAMMGKVPAQKWMTKLSQINPSLMNAIEIKDNKYDVNDLIKKFEYIKTYFRQIQTSSEQLRHLYEAFAPIDRFIDNELYAYNVEINVVYAILQSENMSDTVRQLLLWAEKVDNDCLPYLLIKPA